MLCLALGFVKVSAEGGGILAEGKKKISAEKKKKIAVYLNMSNLMIYEKLLTISIPTRR